MGLRCLLGHDFGEPELEREREEEGEQVVATVREVKRCDRCGESQIVSENTEVTSLDRLAEEANRADRANHADRDGTPANAAPVDEGARDDTGSAVEADHGIETESTGEDAEIIESPATDPDADVGSADAATADATDPTGDSSTDDHGITIEGDVPADGDVDPDAVEEAPPVHETTGTLSPDDGGDAAGTDDGAELIDADDDGDVAVDAAEAAEEPESAAPSSEPSTAAGSEPATDPATAGPGGVERATDAADHPTDDGVILDDDADGADDVPKREHGEWPADDRSRASTGAPEPGEANAAAAPDAADTAAGAGAEDAADASAEDAGETADELRTGHSPWPEQRGEDEGFSADADPDAGESVESAVSFKGGLTPEADGPTDYEEAADVLEQPAAADSGVVSGSAGERGGGPDVEDPGITAAREADVAADPEESTTEYFCPECDLVQPAGRSSMRAGDICPDCKRGYIAERPVSESA